MSELDLDAVRRPGWVPNTIADACQACKTPFSFTVRKHQCKYCGHVYCNPCCNNPRTLPEVYGYKEPQRVCDACARKIDRVDESGTLTAQFYLRDKSIEYGGSLGQIGRRAPPVKCWFTVRSSGLPDALMTLITSEDCIIRSELGRKLFRHVIKTCKHPYLLPVYNADFLVDKNTAIMIRDFSNKGSLRDVIHKANPKWDFAHKYNSKKHISPLDKASIAKYGRQILEALIFLKSLRIPFPHLHSSNVIIYEGNCCITDIENSLLGMSPLYLKHFTEDSSPEVICFGHVLFQMVLGFTKSSSSIEEFADVVPKDIYEILRAIFSPSEKPLSLLKLLEFPLFAKVKLPELKDYELAEYETLDRKVKSFLKKSREQVKEIIVAGIAKRKQREQEQRALADRTPIVEETPDTEFQIQPRKSTKSNANNSKPSPSQAAISSSSTSSSLYTSLNPNDPLNPENRKKAALRAKRAQQRRSTSLQKLKRDAAKEKRRSTVITSYSSQTMPRQKTAAASPLASTSAASPMHASSSAILTVKPSANGVNGHKASPSSGGGAPPPPPPAGAPPPPPPISKAAPVAAPQQGRSALLASICDPSLGKSRLKKVSKK